MYPIFTMFHIWYILLGVLFLHFYYIRIAFVRYSCCTLPSLHFVILWWTPWWDVVMTYFLKKRVVYILLSKIELTQATFKYSLQQIMGTVIFLLFTPSHLPSFSYMLFVSILYHILLTTCPHDNVPCGFAFHIYWVASLPFHQRLTVNSFFEFQIKQL